MTLYGANDSNHYRTTSLAGGKIAVANPLDYQDFDRKLYFEDEYGALVAGVGWRSASRINSPARPASLR